MDAKCDEDPDDTPALEFTGSASVGFGEGPHRSVIVFDARVRKFCEGATNHSVLYAVEAGVAEADIALGASGVRLGLSPLMVVFETG